jgi:hypothetical protein
VYELHALSKMQLKYLCYIIIPAAENPWQTMSLFLQLYTIYVLRYYSVYSSDHCIYKLTVVWYSLNRGTTQSGFTPIAPVTSGGSHFAVCCNPTKFSSTCVARTKQIHKLGCECCFKLPVHPGNLVGLRAMCCHFISNRTALRVPRDCSKVPFQ